MKKWIASALCAVMALSLSAAAFAAHHPDAVAAAEAEVGLQLHILMSTADHRRIHLPHEEIALVARAPGEPLLHGEIKRQRAAGVVALCGKLCVYHLLDMIS